MSINFSDITDYFETCSNRNREKAKATLIHILSMDVLNAKSNREGMQKVTCPSCGSTKWVRNGHSTTGIQHYKCKDCGKAFSSTTNTTFHRTRKNFDVWKKYIDCMVSGLSVRKTVEKCGISHVTVFQWRHKILNYISDYILQHNSGECIDVKTFFREFKLKE